MFFQMLRFEWRWQVQRLTFVAITLVLVGLALVMIRTGYGPHATHINSPYTIMQSCGLLSLWFLLTQTVFCVHGALRDDEYRMEELVLSRPIGTLRLAGSRFVGIVSSGVLVMVLVLLTLMFAPYAIAADPTRVGALRVVPYVWVLLTLVLPNLLLVSALLYAAAMLTRSTIATYVAAIAIFGLYMVTALLVDSPMLAGTAPPTPEALARAAVLDPFGLSAFFEATRYWTPPERNVQLLPLQGRFLINRVLWTSIAVTVLVVTYRLAPLLAARARRAPRRQSDTTAEPAPAHGYATVAPTEGRSAAFWSALRSAVTVECRLLFGTWTVQALLALFVCFVAIEALSELASGEYGTRLLATSALMMRTLAEPLGLLGSLCVIYLAADVAWRERILGVDGLIDATPASNAAFYLAKLFALCAVPLAFTVAGLGTVLAIQLTHGDQPVVPAAYLGQLWFVAVPMMLRVVVVLALQLASPNRWIGLIAGIAFTIVAFGGVVPALEHPMLRFGAVPEAPYSDLDGFGAVPRSFAAIVCYWSSWASLIAIVSWGVWRRGLDLGVRARWRSVTTTWGQAGRWAAAGAALSVMSIGATLYHLTSRNDGWESDSAQTAWRIDYERSYRHASGIPQPSVVDVVLAVDLMPEQRTALVRGTLTLENRDDQPIDSIFLTTRRDAQDVTVRLRHARLVRYDRRFGVWVFALAQPLMAGASRQLDYAYRLDRGGIRLSEFDQDVAENGSYLMSNMLMPSVGYRARYEESNPNTRARAGLGVPSAEFTAVTPTMTDSLTRLARRGAGTAWFTMRATVSTAANQTVIGPGRLARAWTANGRRYFEYVADTPMTPAFSLASARYAVRRLTHNGVAVELWYHPGHDRNADRMLVAAQRSLQVLGDKFGPYPLPVLRMAEVPSAWRFGAYATTGAMYFTEDRGMLADVRAGEVDLVTRRVAHETAHQWWGHTVMPLQLPGSLLLVESLAKYGEQLVVASLFGDEAVAAILAFDHDRYLAERATDASDEPVLVDMTDQSHLYYGKGALAMRALRAGLGDSTMTAILASILASERGPRGAATARQLHGLLRGAARTTDARDLVNEWLLDRVMYDVRADSAWTRPVSNGFHLEASIRVDRLTVVDDVERVAPANGTMIDIVVLGAEAVSPPLHRARVRVENGTVRLSMDLTSRPTAIAADPMIRLIDRERSNNRTTVELRSNIQGVNASAIAGRERSPRISLRDVTSPPNPSGFSTPVVAKGPERDRPLLRRP